MSALLVAAVAEDPAIEWLGGAASFALACGAGWVAYQADEERKRRLSAEQREQEFHDGQW